MRPTRTLLAVAGVILAMTALAPAAAAASPIGSLLLTKTCDAYNHCTVVTSTDGPLPVGTQGFYSGPNFNNRLSSDVLLVTPDLDTADGHCTLSFVSASGTCTFAQGTGALAGFHANLTVTTSDWVTFTWAGTYHWGG
jgi:hypothetical protein